MDAREDDLDVLSMDVLSGDLCTADRVVLEDLVGQVVLECLVVQAVAVPEVPTVPEVQVVQVVHHYPEVQDSRLAREGQEVLVALAGHLLLVVQTVLEVLVDEVVSEET